MNRNERTPRTLAETSFHTGYPAADVERAGKRGDALILVIAAVVTAAWLLPPLVMRAAVLIAGA